jgi:hypothetical protein
MVVIDVSTRKKHLVEIVPVENEDHQSITRKRYFFDWTEERGQEVYGIRIVGTNTFIGLVSFERIPEEWRIHIRLLTVSLENVGRDKKYENIAGNLITFVAKIAVMEFAEMACVSLRPKEAIAQHYIDKFGMNVTGRTLSIEILEIMKLINTYDND